MPSELPTSQLPAHWEPLTHDRPMLSFIFLLVKPPRSLAGRSQAAAPLCAPPPKLATLHIVQNSGMEQHCRHQGTQMLPKCQEPSPCPAAGLGRQDPSCLWPPPQLLLPVGAATVFYPTQTNPTGDSIRVLHWRQSSEGLTPRARKPAAGLRTDGQRWLRAGRAAWWGPAALRGSEDRGQPLETKCRAPKKRQFWSSREEFTAYGLKKKRKRKDRRKNQAREAAATHPPQLKEKPR